MVFFPVGLDLLVGCNGFEGLHQNRFSFICRNRLMWWHFQLAARHFTDSSLKWSFFDFLNRVWFFRFFLFFFASYFWAFHERKIFLTKECVFFWWLPIAFTPTSAFLFKSELEFTVSLKCSNFAVECDWKRILKQIKIWGFFPKLDGFFRTKTWKFSKTLHVANF